MSTESDFRTLLDQLDELEARNDYLERVHILKTEGAGALLTRKPTFNPKEDVFKGETIPPGHGIGNAGQLVVTGTVEAGRRIWGYK